MATSAILLMILLLQPALVMAQVRLGGFGTVGISCFTHDDADFVYNEIPAGPGRSQTCSTELDSKLGLQVASQVTENVAGFLQLTSYHRADGSFQPEVTLANLSVGLTDQTRLRLGRVQNPNFLFSEHRNVHFAQPWVRPPTEVYGVLTTYLFDGIEINHDMMWSDAYLGLVGGIASAEFDVPRSNVRGTDSIDGEVLYLTASLEKGPWEFKMGYSTGEATFRPVAAVELFVNLQGAGFQSLADQLDINESRFTIYSLAAKYEIPNWLVIAEYASRELEGFFRDISGFYLTVAYQGMSWKPYVTLARRTNGKAQLENTVPAVGALVPLSAGVDSILGSGNSDSSSISLGVSRELTETSILKLEAKRIDNDRLSNHTLFNQGPGFDGRNQDDEWLLSINLDFVF